MGMRAYGATALSKRSRHTGYLAVFVLLWAVSGWLPGCGGGGNGSGPAAPPSLSPPSSVTADAGNARVILNWSPVAGASTYNVYYAPAPGVTKRNGIKIEDQHGPLTQRDLTNGVKYYFVVASVDANGEGTVSREVSATPSATPPPQAPTGVTAGSEGGQIRVNWSPSTGAATYKIYYGTTANVTPATGIPVANAVPPQVVGPLANGTTYYLVVTASNANGESATSFEVSGVPLAAPPPVAPTGVTAAEGNGQITLAWAPVADAASYNVYYGTDVYVSKDPRTWIEKIPNATSPRTITGLTNKTAYFLVVTAVNGNGESAESPAVSATPLSQKPVSALIRIPGGPFQMGDNLDNTSYASPVHSVNVDTIYIDRYETTYELWKVVRDWAVSHGYTDLPAGGNGSLGTGTNMPVTIVSWYDVTKWLNARSEMEGRGPVYYTDTTHTAVYRTGQVDLTNDMVNWADNGYRLPTEAEWEKAARGGFAGLRYPWGNDLGGTANGNWNMGRTVSVGLYPPNGYGLYDMAGNVWEWTWDWVADIPSNDYRLAIVGGIGIDNYRGPDSGGTSRLRVRRGGSFAYGSQYLRCFERMFRIPIYTAPYFGFRSASNAP